MEQGEIRWSIRIFPQHADETHYHLCVVRTALDSKYQVDGEENTQEFAIASALKHISDFERL